jgi:hypothetical protein
MPFQLVAFWERTSRTAFFHTDTPAFEFLRWMQNFQQSMWGHDILFQIDLEGWTTLNKTIFVKNKKYEFGSRLKHKIHILFYGDNSWTITLRQMKFDVWTYLQGLVKLLFCFMLLYIAMVWIYEIMMWQTLNCCV